MSADSQAPLARPELVFFDLGDTLVRAHPSWTAVYLSALAEHGLTVREEDLERALLDGADSGFWSLEGPFEATEEASWARIVEFDRSILAALGHPDLPEDVFRSIEQSFARRSAWHIFPDVHPALDALREAGIRAAIISNWLWGAPELLHDLELASHFEALIISARVGYQKPHPEIFRHALRVTGVDASRAIHVGDSYRADVQGARRVGIRPVLIRRGHADAARIPSPPDDGDVRVIEGLGELLALIGLPQPAVPRIS